MKRKIKLKRWKKKMNSRSMHEVLLAEKKRGIVK